MQIVCNEWRDREIQKYLMRIEIKLLLIRTEKKTHTRFSNRKDNEVGGAAMECQEWMTDWLLFPRLSHPTALLVARGLFSLYFVYKDSMPARGSRSEIGGRFHPLAE